MDKYKKYDINKIGAKAYNLNILEQAGFNVPKWFCLPFDILDKYQNYNENDNSFRSDFEKEIMQYVNDNFEDGTMFSIRSSSLVEDKDDLSYAGQFDTFLSINKNDILLNINKCIQGVNNENIQKYSNKQEKIGIGIIVQELIMPDISGVAFTANPLGLLNETVVVCGSGIGKNIVENIVPVTTYYYNKDDESSYFERQENASILTNNQFKEIIKYVNKVYEIYNKEMDIEWCILNDKLYILQARPITTLDMNKETYILDNSNIVESYPGITLPLSQGFVKRAYYLVFKRAFERLVDNKKIVNNNDENLKQMVTSANGRMYYIISNWYLFIKYMPFSKKIIPIWQEMLGVRNKNVITKNIKVGVFSKDKILINSIMLLSSVDKNMKKLNEYFKQIPIYFNQEFTNNMNNKELLQLYFELEKRLTNNWDITLVNDMSTFIFTGLLKNKFKKMGIDNYDILTNKYISGLSDIDSIKPIKKLIEIASIALQNEDILKKLKQIENDNQWYEFMQNVSSESEKNFISIFSEYLEEYGDRCVEELKFESKTFRSSPITFVKKILQYTENREKLEGIKNIIENRVDNEKYKNINVKKTMLTKMYIKKATSGVKNREISRLNRSRIYGMIRKIFIQIGENLYNENILDDINDIFYLDFEQLINMINNDEFDKSKIKENINTKKLEYILFKNLPTYSRLVFLGQPFDKRPLNINDNVTEVNSKEIHGVPCSEGEIEGEVLVVKDPKEVIDAKDKILVTKTTDPGWVFLITMAKGIISEKGSLLSHTAIVSRELKIPSIVGVPNITKILKTGDKIILNGNTGKIKII